MSPPIILPPPPAPPIGEPVSPVLPPGGGIVPVIGTEIKTEPKDDGIAAQQKNEDANNEPDVENENSTGKESEADSTVC